MPKPEGMSRNKWKRVKRILNRKEAWDQAVRATCGYKLSPVRHVIGYLPTECKTCPLKKECRAELYEVVQARLDKDLETDSTRPALDKAVKIIKERMKKEEEELAKLLEGTRMSFK